MIQTGSAKRTFTAAEIGVDYHAIADAYVIHAVTQRDYISCSIRSRNVRQRQLESGPAIPNPNINMVEGSCPQADQSLVRAGLGVGKISVLEDLGPTVLVEVDGFQCLSS
jgi:hypothetical protein